MILALPRYQLELRAWYKYPRVVEAIATSLAHVLCYLRNVDHILLSSSIRKLAKAAFSTKLIGILAERDRVDQVLSEEIRLAQAQGISSSSGSLSNIMLTRDRADGIEAG
jgi:hypothetical protein